MYIETEDTSWLKESKGCEQRAFYLKQDQLGIFATFAKRNKIICNICKENKLFAIITTIKLKIPISCNLTLLLKP